MSRAEARQIVGGTLSFAAEKGMKPIAVVVLDAGGHVVAFERADGCFPGSFRLAQGKAYGVAMMNMSGTALEDMARAAPDFTASLAGVFDGDMVPCRGGILVRNSAGDVVAAVGVTGDTSENDMAAGLAGIASAGLSGEA